MAKNRGFTLIELMVVLTIIGILAGFGFTNFMTSQKRARDGRRKADLEEIRGALEMCYTDDGLYPALIAGSVTCAISGGVYLNPTPTDPKNGSAYSYTRTSTTTYSLCTTLEVTTDPDYPDYCVSNP